MKQMQKTKIQYILTWASMGIMLLSGIGLMAVAWNGIAGGSPSQSLVVLLWICMSASGIYLFMLAVKKAHRTWITDMQEQKKEDSGATGRASETRSKSKDSQSLDFSATARKLVRRIPEEASLEEGGKELMKNLAKELEIMSGILYLRKGTRFEASTSYAIASSTEPYVFKEGEGLSGQVARNQQLMVLTRLPEGHLEVYSGLGKAEPKYLALIPFIQKGRTVGLLECSGYRFDPKDIESMFRILSRDMMEKISKKT